MPPLKPYADSSGRRTGQVLGDVLAVVWVVLCYQAAWWLHDAVLLAGVPGRTLDQAGTSLADNLASASTAVQGLPLVGDSLTSALRSAGQSAQSLSQAGRDLQSTVDTVARVTGVLAFVLPVALAVAVWVLPRVRFARNAGAALGLVASAANLELFALRALARQPLTVLASVSPDPVGSWRSGDAAVVRRLAELELGEAGVRAPGPSSAPQPRVGRPGRVDRLE